MREHRWAKVLSILVIMAFLVSAGVVGCGPTAGPPPGPTPGGPPAGQQPPGGQLPGEQPPGGPAPGGEPPGGPAPGGGLQLVLVADPDMVPQGGCAMLRWEVSPPGEYRVVVDGQEVLPLGEQQVCPPGTTTYELRVETPGGPQVRTVTVNVGGGPGGGPQPTEPGPGPAPTTAAGGGCAGAPTFTSFTASASSISAGQQVQLSWGAVTTGTSGPLVGSVVLSPGGFGEVGSPGSRWASPTTTTTYRLTATGCGGTATKDVTVTVGGAGPAATATPHPAGPTATPQPSGPTATTQAAATSADVWPSDLYPDNQPQGNIWVRIFNNGPRTLTNKKVRISGSLQQGTRTTPPSASGYNIPGVEHTISSLAPGQQLNINLGSDWQLDLTQYDYQFTVKVEAVDFTDPNTGNNSYSENFGASFTVSFVKVSMCDLVQSGTTSRAVVFQVKNTGTMTFESATLTVPRPGQGDFWGGTYNTFLSGADGCPLGSSTLAPGATAYTATSVVNDHGATMATIMLSTKDYPNQWTGVHVERELSFTIP